jgi:diguanylate cyclase (GGDEF)-like protein
MDDLTQVGNRRSIERRLAEVLTGDVLVMCDLDHFKALNDVAGHAAGDEVLRDFGAIIRGCLRGDDYVGRYGGEEFVLVLAETKLADVDDVLRRVRRRFQRLHPTVTFSAGYAGHDDTHSAEQTLSEADAALYIAKDHGRDRFVASVTDIVRA